MAALFTNKSNVDESKTDHCHSQVGITVLGATGSIGINTLNVIEQHNEQYRVVALSANKQIDRLFDLCVKFKPEFAVVVDPVASQQLSDRLKVAHQTIEVLAGAEGLETVVRLPQTDYVMAAIVGAAGLRSTLAAAKAGKRILLANKEALVMSGKLLTDEIKASGGLILPIDSEHNAIFQCMPNPYTSKNASLSLESMGVRRIWLTASGGPFRELPVSQLTDVTPDQACAHPKWKMGRKISVDSATMMNKGLEVIEACWLFNTTASTIQVVIHPESIVHSLVEYIDGSVLAQMGYPDMRTPIAHALAWPKRTSSGVAAFDLFNIGQLNFKKPDLDQFPCLRLALDVAKSGGTSATILNAANEIAVEAFLNKRVRFTSIAEIIEETLNVTPPSMPVSLETILETDRIARHNAEQSVASLMQ